MPRDGNGNYARAVAPYVAGDIAESDGGDGVNTEMDDFADALTDSLARNGEAAWTGDQDAAGFTVTGLAESSANGEAVRHEQLTALASLYEAKDPTLTAIAGTVFAAGQVLRATGPDTFTVDNTTAFGRALWNVADLAATVTALGGAAAIRAAVDLEPGVDVQAYSAALAIYAGISPAADVQSVLGAANSAAIRALLSLGSAALLAEMTTAEFWANTADRVVSTDQAWAAADPVPIAYGASTTLNFATFINAVITLTGNITFNNPSNLKKGQAGCIELIHSGAARTAAWGTEFVFAGGADLVLSTTGSGVRDLVFYEVLDDSKIFVSLAKDVKN